MNILVIHHKKTDIRYYKIIGFLSESDKVIEEIIKEKNLSGRMSFEVYNKDGALIGAWCR